MGIERKTVLYNVKGDTCVVFLGIGKPHVASICKPHRSGSQRSVVLPLLGYLVDRKQRVWRRGRRGGSPTQHNKRVAQTLPNFGISHSTFVLLKKPHYKYLNLENNFVYIRKHRHF